MLYRLREYTSKNLTQVFEPSFGQRMKYTAAQGMVVISTANSNLDGTGTIGTLYTDSGGSNGTRVLAIKIKALGSTTLGMIRFYLQDDAPSFTNIIAEIPVPEKTVSAVDSAWEININVNWWLKTLHSIRVSTEKAESFAITAECETLSFP